MWQGLWNWQIPENGSPEENGKHCRAFTLDHVVEWVEKYENMDERFCFFETCVRFSQMYQLIEKSLLSTLDKVCWLNCP